MEHLIERAAARHGLAPDLIRSVIRTESAFDPRAVSPAGARGLMQLMPATAAELGVTDPFDPEQNIMAGTRYLRQLLDRYNGDLDHALAAYNWGMGNVDRHGLARLPEETRNYLLRIKQA
jgi:soluble lytic murein transglycosylase-like protein